MYRPRPSSQTTYVIFNIRSAPELAFEAVENSPDCKTLKRARDGDLVAEMPSGLCREDLRRKFAEAYEDEEDEINSDAELELLFYRFINARRLFVTRVYKPDEDCYACGGTGTAYICDGMYGPCITGCGGGIDDNLLAGRPRLRQPRKYPRAFPKQP